MVARLEETGEAQEKTVSKLTLGLQTEKEANSGLQQQLATLSEVIKGRDALIKSKDSEIQRLLIKIKRLDKERDILTINTARATSKTVQELPIVESPLSPSSMFPPIKPTKTQLKNLQLFQQND
jgi:vacuolar-type H+-ATPase subunit I/STV1